MYAGKYIWSCIALGHSSYRMNMIRPVRKSHITSFWIYHNCQAIYNSAHSIIYHFHYNVLNLNINCPSIYIQRHNPYDKLLITIKMRTHACGKIIRIFVPINYAVFDRPSCSFGISIPTRISRHNHRINSAHYY